MRIQTVFKIHKDKLISRLFCAWFLATVFSYVIYMATALTNSKFVYWSYKFIELPEELSYIVRLKEILAILLLVLMISKIYRYYLLVLMLALYALLITLIQSGQDFFLLIAAGGREFLPVLVCFVLYHRYRGNVTCFDKDIFTRVVLISIILETVAILIHIAVFDMWYSIGKAGNRIPGTFGNGGDLGYFAIGTAIYIYSLYLTNNLNRGMTVLFILFSGLIALASGARNSLFIIAIVACFLLIEFILGFSERIRKKIYIVVLPLLMFVSFPLINIMEKYIERGGIEVSGTGRLTYFSNLFLRTSSQILFGKGLGDSTNTAVNLGLDTHYVDGTISAILAQFGIIGVFVFLYFLLKLFSNLLRNNTKVINASIIYVISLLIVIISINIFEQPTLIILYFMTYSLITSDSKSKISILFTPKNDK